MQTYPEMNGLIVGILRISDKPEVLYAAQRIEELEKELECLRSQLNSLLNRGYTEEE